MTERYDDFALPSLENIEQMAKAYRQMEEQSKSELTVKGVDRETIQNVYECIYNTFNILSKFCQMYPKNRKFTGLCDKLGKMKNEFESDFLDYELVVPVNQYTFAENTLIFDFIKLYTNCIKNIFTNFTSETLKSKYILYFLDIIDLMVKY